MKHPSITKAQVEALKPLAAGGWIEESLISYETQIAIVPHRNHVGRPLHASTFLSLQNTEWLEPKRKSLNMISWRITEAGRTRLQRYLDRSAKLRQTCPA